MYKSKWLNSQPGKDIFWCLCVITRTQCKTHIMLIYAFFWLQPPATREQLTRCGSACIASMFRGKMRTGLQASPSETRTVTGASLERFRPLYDSDFWHEIPVRPENCPEGAFNTQLCKPSTCTWLFPSAFVRPLSLHMGTAAEWGP